MSLSEQFMNTSGRHIPKQLLRACTIIDRIRMRTMLPMDEQITSKEIETFFNEVGYVTEINRAANARRNKGEE